MPEGGGDETIVKMYEEYVKVSKDSRSKKPFLQPRARGAGWRSYDPAAAKKTERVGMMEPHVPQKFLAARVNLVRRGVAAQEGTRDDRVQQSDVEYSSSFQLRPTSLLRSNSHRPYHLTPLSQIDINHQSCHQNTLSSTATFIFGLPQLQMRMATHG
jgi:hypothetical protein